MFCVIFAVEEPASRTNELVKRIARFDAVIRMMSKKRALIAVVEKRKGAKFLN